MAALGDAHCIARSLKSMVSVVEKMVAWETSEQHVTCPHYRRRCRIVAKCCEGRAYGCRICHDDAVVAASGTLHRLDRFSIEQIECARCGLRQRPRERCLACFTQFGQYFCEVCCLYDDDHRAKGTYHCDGCGICRVGGCDNFFHCSTCDGCYPQKTRAQHRCLQARMRGTCPICQESLFDSRIAAMITSCGHHMHTSCFQELVASATTASWRCPVCQTPM